MTGCKVDGNIGSGNGAGAWFTTGTKLVMDGSSVSKNTNYLINNDNTSSSAKNVAAQKLGVPVLTEAEFIEKFLTN